MDIRRKLALQGCIIAFVIAVAWFGLGLTGWLSTVPMMPCLFQTGYVPIDRQQLRGSGQIYFIPLDNFSQDRAQGLAQYYLEKYGVTIEVTSPITLPKTTFNEARKQYVAESVIAFLRNELLFSNPESIKIALTDRDIYIKSYTWNYGVNKGVASSPYVFSYSEPPIAVVSSARMNHRVLGVSLDRQESRFRKMVSKNIGMLYYHLPSSQYCRSVMYGNLARTQERPYGPPEDRPQQLDLIGEDF